MKSNIVFFLSDQHNSRVLGCAGDTLARTPHLDRLSREGARFSNAYCQNPLCVPSRSSMITGRYCRSIGIYDNRQILADDALTFPSVFADAGYRTCLIGKAHFNGDQYHGYRERPYGDILGQGHQPDPERLPEYGESGLGGVLTAAGPSRIPLAMTQTEICVAEAAKWLQIHGQNAEPFLLSVHFDKPHFPLCPPENYFRSFDGRLPLPDVPAGSLENEVAFVRNAYETNGEIAHYRTDPEMHARARAAYYGCVEWIDDAIGRILDTLDHLGLTENTIVVYASDHGDMLGERGAWQKTVFFDASSKVPCIIRWPKEIPAGTCIDDIVGLIDLMPTLCEAAGIQVPGSCEGFSLVPLMTGTGSITRDGIFSESVVLRRPEHAGCMLRSGSWKYSLYEDGAEELYHLDNDPPELRNLAHANEHAETVRRMRARVAEFCGTSGERARKAAQHSDRDKHFYPYSNQFILDDGTMIDARP